MDKLITDIAFLVIAHHGGIQKPWEEEKAENEEHDKEFHKYNEPQGTSQGHASKAFYIEIPDVEQCILHNTGFITSQN